MLNVLCVVENYLIVDKPKFPMLKFTFPNNMAFSFILIVMVTISLFMSCTPVACGLLLD